MKNTFIYIILIISLYSLVISSPKWYIETVDDTFCVGDDTSIKLDSNDYPHISYNETNYDGELRYAFFDGEKWNIEIVDNNGNIQGSTSLALDSKDHPHIAYKDYTNNAGGLKYAYFDGTKWNIEMVDSGYRVGLYTSIALDLKDNPHISYCDVKNYDLKYAYFDGTKWNIETVDSQGKVGWYSSIVIDSNDHPHISYDDETNHHLKYAYFDGTKWNIEIVDNSDCGRSTSITLDKKGNPHISYMGGYPYGLKYAYFDGSKWNTEIIDTDYIGGFISLALDSNDLPHISYNYWMDYPDIKRLMYIYFDVKDWHKEIVDGDNDGFYTSIAIDRYDFPHISYCGKQHLKYARYGYGLGITLTSFTAKPNNDAITLNWSVTTDECISGFNLYRRVATPTVSPVRELAPPVLTDWSGKGMPGGIAQSPEYSTTANLTTVGKDDNPCPNADSQWTKVNTSLITGTNPYSYTDGDVLPETRYEYKLEAVVSDKNETLGTTECKSGNENPASFEIARIYPTPALSHISIDVIIPEQTDIEITIYDITGRKVGTIAGGQYNSGEYTLTGDVSDLTNGVYIMRMTAKGLSVSKNFVVAK